MNSTSISLTDRLSIIQYNITIYFLTSILILGHIGNLGSLIIFSQKVLRTNICSWYFLILSSGNLMTLYVGCCSRIVASWTGYELTRVSIGFCKLRIYFILFGISLSRNFLALIAIDRWMITSRNVQIRRLSTSKIALPLIIISIIFWTVFNVYIIIGYQLDINSNGVKTLAESYVLVYTIFALFSITFPLSLMILFSILSILNVKKMISQQILPATIIHFNVIQRGAYRRKDLALIKLSLVQVTVYLILNLLDMYNTIYGFTSRKIIKTNEQAVIDGFIGLLGYYLLYLYCATTFWSYLLVSKTFRKECITAWKNTFAQSLVQI